MGSLLNRAGHQDVSGPSQCDVTNTSARNLSLAFNFGQKPSKDDNRIYLEEGGSNKKFIHYNDEVLLPFIRSIRKQLGWFFDPESDVPVPEYLKAVSWFDGDIGQLQTMIDEARQSLDEAEKIIRNKHTAATTAHTQPCDLSPVFRLMKKFQLNNSAVYWDRK